MNREQALEQIVYNLRHHPHPDLPNGATMLCTEALDHESYRIIALWERPSKPEYVVWKMFADGSCVWGHYYRTLEGALDHFLGEKRECEHKFRDYGEVGVVCRDCGAEAPPEIAASILHSV